MDDLSYISILCECGIPIPYFIDGDDIFALKTWLQRSLPGRSKLSEAQQIFSYRLPRARRVIENTFVLTCFEEIQ